jgi:Fic family protein
MKFIYNNEDWPKFIFNSDKILTLLGRVRNLQGNLSGKMQSLGFTLRNDAWLEALSLDVIMSSEIEGEILNSDQVRSSIARKLGIDFSGMVETNRDVEGIVQMMLDASQNNRQLLTKEKLFDWHSAMFATGRSGMYKIIVGNWRDDASGPMQVISSPISDEKIHFQAPPASVIEKEINNFLHWFNENDNFDPMIKAGIAHLWFVTIHPFEDGNGRITRALTDMILSSSELSTQRFYSLSAQIRKERNKYYDVLEKTQKGTLNITNWLEWFLESLERAIISSDEIVQKVLYKHQFWICHKEIELNARQSLMVKKLLDGFIGKLNTSKWAKINKCSPDTALRDIQDLVEKRILDKEAAGGRSTSYILNH